MAEKKHHSFVGSRANVSLPISQAIEELGLRDELDIFIREQIAFREGAEMHIAFLAKEKGL